MERNRSWPEWETGSVTIERYLGRKARELWKRKKKRKHLHHHRCFGGREYTYAWLYKFHKQPPSFFEEPFSLFTTKDFFYNFDGDPSTGWSKKTNILDSKTGLLRIDSIYINLFLIEVWFTVHFWEGSLRVLNINTHRIVYILENFYVWYWVRELYFSITSQMVRVSE